MIELSQVRTRRLLTIHGWSGVLTGLFLYVVLLTGALAVFAHEIGVWSVGGSKVPQPLAQPVDATLRELADRVPAEHLEDVSVFHNAAGDVIAFFHTHRDNPEIGAVDDYGTWFEVDPLSGEVLVTRSGFGNDLFSADPAGALDHFLVDLHVNLHAADPWGLYATGILGLVMLVAGVSGLLIHRHLIKDAFLAPRKPGSLLNRKDRHVLAGTWGLLFAVVLGFTGSFYSFAGALGFPLVASTAFGGDQTAMFETLFGAPAVADPSPVPVTDLDDVLDRAAAEAGTTSTFFSVEHWGRADARIQVFHPEAEGDLLATNLVFHGTTGAFLGSKPILGTEPSAGAAAYALMAPLHFGHFAGLASKVVWLLLGLAMCYLAVTGLQLWLQRRADQPGWQRIGRSVPIVVFGTPIGLAGAAHGFFLSPHGADPQLWTPVGFLLLAAVSIILGVILPRARIDKTLSVLLATLLVLLPMVRLLGGGPTWGEALATDNGIVVALDVVMLTVGVAFSVAAFRPRHRLRFASSVPRSVGG